MTEIRNTNGLIESLFAQRFSSQSDSVPSDARPKGPPRTEQVSSSRDVVETNQIQAIQSGQTQTLSSVIEIIERGFRRTQQFERPDGQTFSRAEEFTTTERGFRRTVTQENASGSTTRLEENINPQDNGLFTRTSFFTDESGQTRSSVEENIAINDPFVLSGGLVARNDNPSPFSTLRGTQLDIQA